ncbi:MAG: hypothetical protein KGL11_13560 [Alphaproteobacteria bacterium]|nr:hypothetical protein [Alphaproteobacteria bacterium]
MRDVERFLVQRDACVRKKQPQERVDAPQNRYQEGIFGVALGGVQGFDQKPPGVGIPSESISASDRLGRLSPSLPEPFADATLAENGEPAGESDILFVELTPFGLCPFDGLLGLTTPELDLFGLGRGERWKWPPGVALRTLSVSSGTHVASHFGV